MIATATATAGVSSFVAIGEARGSETEEGVAAPDPVPTHPQWGFVLGGAAVLALGHVTPIVIAADSNFANGGGWFAAPVVGPWAYLIARDGCGKRDDEVSASVCDVGNVLLITVVVMDALVQLTGTALIVVGLVAQRPDKPKPSAFGVLPTVITTPTGAMVPALAGSF